MKYYANLQVQGNGFVELRHDKVTHFYSVPYIHIGKKSLVFFAEKMRYPVSCAFPLPTNVRKRLMPSFL